MLLRYIASASIFTAAALSASFSSASNYQVEYRFKGAPDGAYPEYLTLDAKGIFYGLAGGGGNYDNVHCGDGCGTIFIFDPKIGKFTSVHKFSGSVDGLFPNGPLVEGPSGEFYGTTGFGGPGVTAGGGTIFKFDPAAKKVTTLYTMAHSDDPSAPNTGVTLANGSLYGATLFGGAGHNEGVVYKYNLGTGKFKIVYVFDGNSGDWMNNGMTLGKDGMLYGATAMGGKNGAGVIFRVNPNVDKLVPLRNMTWSDGGVTSPLVVGADGMLYGTTTSGSTKEDCSKQGCGVLFKFDPVKRTYTTLHRFAGAQDGSQPAGNLATRSGGVIYGFTQHGSTYGKGALFAFDTKASRFIVAHAFANISGGQAGHGVAFDPKGALFGTTSDGGLANTTHCQSDGCGTIFKFTP